MQRRRWSRGAWLLTGAVLLSPIAVAWADPVSLSHSGYLVDGQDHPVNGSASLEVSLWSDPASTNSADRVWPVGTVATCTVPVREGRFAVEVGAPGAGGCGTGLTSEHVPAGATRWMELSVGGVTLLPRLRLSTVPTAHRAAHALLADEAARIGGQTLSDLDGRFVRASAGSLQSIAGSLGIQGDVTLTGGRFIGDGSGLTNVAATSLTSTLSVDKGGTGATALPVSAVLLGNGTGTLSAVSGLGAAGQVLTSNGPGGSPTWQTITSPTWSQVAGGIHYSGGNVGIGTTTPAASVETTGGMRIGNDTGPCNAGRSGTIKFQSGTMWACDGTTWKVVSLVDPSANVVLMSGSGIGMDVAGPGNPAYGTPVTFTYQNIGIESTVTMNTSLVNPANFEITADTCKGNVLGRNGTCTVTVRSKATGNGSLAGSLNLSW